MDHADEISRLLQQVDQLNEEKQQLIGLISHDLRSPFNRLHALLQLLNMDDKRLSAEQCLYVEKMHIVVADALSMMRNLTDYRSVELNLLTVHPRPVDLHELLNTVVNSYMAYASRKSITLKLLETIPGLKVEVDPYCLTRAVENLVSNAIKFSFQEKSVGLQIKQTNHSIYVEITDQGQGLKPEEIPLIGRKFLKLSARPTGGESSVGLGLFLASEMIRLLGGQLNVRSEPGKGSTFSLVLNKQQNL